MRLLLFITLLFSSVNINAQSVIRWAHDSVELFSFQKIITHTGDEMNGYLKVENSNSTTEYQIQNGYIKLRLDYNTKNIQTEAINYQEGKLHGVYKRWNEQGVLLIDGYYKNGLEDSLWIYYYNNGKKQLEGHYLADSTIKFDNFQFTVAIKYINDYEEGLKIITSESENHSPPDGIWNVFDKKGDLLQSFHFNKGTLVRINLNTDQ